MEIIAQENIKSLKFPLLIYSAVSVAHATSKEGDNFSIFAGLDKNLVSQLRTLSLDQSDTELQKNTSDYKRFGEGFYKDWYRKGRTPFALVHTDTNKLAGIVWFGPKPLGKKSLKHLSSKELFITESINDAENWHTIAYRCYPSFRGKGITKDFVGFVTDVYTKSIPNIKLWAGINTKNLASRALAESLGLKPVETLSDPTTDHLVMAKENFN
jgi:RimJ/RimL family protein N-acetyltransferase